MMYYDRMGRPITRELWGELFENSLYKIVKQDHFDDLMVSTVWLGIDHSFGSGPPIIFETLVLKDDYSEVDGMRYETEDEALEGHKELFKKVRDIGYAGYEDE